VRQFFLLDKFFLRDQNRLMDFQTHAEVAALIAAAGGQTELARRLGFDKNTGRQRVNAWKSNGKVPPMVVRAYKPMFKRIMTRAAAAVVADPAPSPAPSPAASPESSTAEMGQS